MKYQENEELFQFIDSNPTCYQVVETMTNEYIKSGFQELLEKDSWNLERGKSYFVTRNGSAILAFTIPKGTISGFHISASHSDSPCFRIKENPEMKTGTYVKLNTEKYGGMIYSSWLDRPLSIAGRVIIKEKKQLVAKTVVLEDGCCIIPNVAIHLNSEVNKGFEYNPQTDLLPLFLETEGNSESDTLLAIVAKKLGIKKEEILGNDLYIVNREKARYLGADGAFIGAPRLDDQQCIFATMKGFLRAKGKSENFVNVHVVFNNEEVGSTTRQGACSTFLKDTLVRITATFGENQDAYCRWLANSFLISADNAQGFHPNHSEKSDPTNQPRLNGGIVLKYHGGQKYATDGFSAAVFRDICQQADVPVQTYANRSDLAGGMTLGNLSTQQVAIDTVDIGLAQLSMHSSFETAGTKDTAFLVKAMEYFYGL